MNKRKVKFERLDKELPFFRDSMPKDYVQPEPSEKQKEWADKICKWLFSENDNEPVPKEALQFIGFMKIVHTVSQPRGQGGRLQICYREFKSP